MISIVLPSSKVIFVPYSPFVPLQGVSALCPVLNPLLEPLSSDAQFKVCMIITCPAYGLGGRMYVQVNKDVDLRTMLWTSPLAPVKVPRPS